MHDYCRAQGDLTLLAFSALLGGTYASGKLSAPYDTTENIFRLERIRNVAAERGATPNQVVLAWMLASDPVVLPLVATASLAHLHENLRGLDLRPDKETMDKINLPV